MVDQTSINKRFEKIQYKFIQDLIDYGASYASIIWIFSQNKYFCSSSEKWDEIYQNSGAVDKCRLILRTQKLKENNDNFTLFWDSVPLIDQFSQDLEEKRKSLDICHGVSFCFRNKDKSLLTFNIASRWCDLDFSKHVLAHKSDILGNFNTIIARIHDI